LQHNIGDDLIQKHGYIDANQEFTRCEIWHNILPLFRGLEGSLTFSPLLSYTKKQNWENLAWLAWWWSKPQDVDACPHTVFIHSSVLRHKLTNLLPFGFEAQNKNPSWWFWGPNHQTIDLGFNAQIKKPSRRFYGTNHQTTTAGFEAQTGKPERVVLRPNHMNQSYQFWDQTRRNHRPWFWGLTNSRSSSPCAWCRPHTVHPTYRSSGHRVPDCTWPFLVLCTKSPIPVSILVTACHATPVTYTSRDKQTCFYTWNR
jgi:hypothetical protein